MNPDLTAYNAVLAACRKCRAPTDALRIWDDLLNNMTPDAISVAETIACLDRSQRFTDADRVLTQALERRVRLKGSTLLDAHNELDVSATSVPVAKARVRRAFASWDRTPLTIITGLGVRANKDTKHTSLKSIVLDMVAQDDALTATVRAETPGSIVIEVKH